MRTLIPLCAALLLAACGSSLQSADGSEVTLNVEPASAPAGAEVSLILRNGSASEVGYNLCASGMERREASGWAPVQSDRVCTMELRTRPPGEEARYQLQLPATLATGEYRFLTNVDGMGAGESGAVRSGSFQVR